MYLAFTRDHGVLLAVLGSTYSLKPVGFTGPVHHRGHGEGPKILGT